jgi:hypothetical protein
MTEVLNTFSAKIILGFMKPENKVRFFISAQDGITPCVEWLSHGRWQNATTVELARRIHRHKKMVAMGRVF